MTTPTPASADMKSRRAKTRVERSNEIWVTSLDTVNWSNSLRERNTDDWNVLAALTDMTVTPEEENVTSARGLFWAEETDVRADSSSRASGKVT